MKERLPSLVAVLLLALLVLGTWWASDYTLRTIQIDPAPRITHERDAWAQAFTMVRTDAQGLAINRLEGTAMEHFPDTDSYEITAPRAVDHQPDTPVTVASAQHGTLDRHGTRIVLDGDAHVHRLADADHQALDLRSAQLIIEPDENLVYTDQPATVFNGRSTLRGTGMRYDNRTRQLTVHAATDVKLSAEDQAAHQDRTESPSP